MSKIGGVVVSHGRLASELVLAAEQVAGDLPHIKAVSIGWHDDVELASSEVERAIEQVDDGKGVLLLTDMFGGTPTNITAMYFEEGKTEVLTGVNLPMVIKLATQEDDVELSEMALDLEEQGKQSIYRAGDLLALKRKDA